MMNNSQFKTFNPAFVLRVNYNEVLERYFKGEFSNLKKGNEKVEIKMGGINFVAFTPESPEEALYLFKDKNSNQHIIVFANQEEYLAFKEGKKINHRCQLCFKKFDYTPERIPLFIEDRYLKDPDDASIKIKSKIVWSCGIYCHPNHCYTAICMLTSRKKRDSSWKYTNSELYYKNICLERFPDIQLEEVDISLLSRFGGSLSQKDFDDPEYKYKQIESMFIVPVKIPYEKIKR